MQPEVFISCGEYLLVVYHLSATSSQSPGIAYHQCSMIGGHVTENEAECCYQDGIDHCAVSNRVRVGLGLSLSARESFIAAASSGSLGIGCRLQACDIGRYLFHY